MPIKPEGGKVIPESAHKLGFTAVLDNLCESWSWGDEASNSCLTEKEGLQCFMNTIQEEMKTSNSSGVILLTPRKDLTLPVLLAAINKCSFAGSFLQMVKGVGSVQELATANNIPLDNTNNLSEYEKYYSKSFEKAIDFSKPQNVPKGAYQILESLLKSSPNYDNFFSEYVHPTVSPYTNSLLLSSKIPGLREDYYDIQVIDDVEILANSQQHIRVNICGVLKTEIGKDLHILSSIQVTFVNKTIKVGKNLTADICIENQCSQVLNVVQGAHIGLAHISSYFLFPDRIVNKPVTSRSEEPFNSQIQPSPGNIDSSEGKEMAETNDQPISFAPKKKRNLPGMWPSSSDFSTTDEIVKAHQSIKSVRRPEELSKKLEAHTETKKQIPEPSGSGTSKRLNEFSVKKPLKRKLAELNQAKHITTKIPEENSSHEITEIHASEEIAEIICSPLITPNKDKRLEKTMEVEVIDLENTALPRRNNLDKQSEESNVEVTIVDTIITVKEKAITEIVEINENDDEITEIYFENDKNSSSSCSAIEITNILDDEDSEDISCIEIVPKKKEGVKFMRNGCAYVDPTMIQRKIREYMEKKNKIGDNDGVKNKTKETSGKNKSGISESQDKTYELYEAMDTSIENEDDSQIENFSFEESLNNNRELENECSALPPMPETSIIGNIKNVKNDDKFEEDSGISRSRGEHTKEIKKGDNEAQAIEVNQTSTITAFEEDSDKKLGRKTSNICEPNLEISPDVKLMEDEIENRNKTYYKDSEKEENNSLNSILIVNPISVGLTGTMVHAPLNQVDSSGGKRWTCDHCVKTYKNRRDLVEHTRDHFQTYICPVCEKVCHSKRYLKDHSSKCNHDKPLNNLEKITNFDLTLVDADDDMVEGQSNADDQGVHRHPGSSRPTVEPSCSNQEDVSVCANIKTTGKFKFDAFENLKEIKVLENLSDSETDLEMSDIVTEDELKVNISNSEGNHIGLDLNDKGINLKDADALFDHIDSDNIVESENDNNKKQEKSPQKKVVWKVSKKFAASSTSGKQKLVEVKKKSPELKYRLEKKISKETQQNNEKKKTIPTEKSPIQNENTLTIRIINDVNVDDIVDISSNQVKKYNRRLTSCCKCAMKFKTQKALTSHVAKVHKNCDSMKEPTQNKNHKTGSEDTDLIPVNENPWVEKKDKNIDEINQTVNYVKDDMPIVSQIKNAVNKMIPIEIRNDLDLSEEFSSLLTAPQLAGLIRTFIQFHQVPIDCLDINQRMFGDLLVSELVVADIVDYESLEQIMVNIHMKSTSADLISWRESISKEIESLSLASEVDRNFQLDIAIQIMILHCLPALVRAGSCQS